MKLLLLIFKNLRRTPIRSLLVGMAIGALVLVFSMILTVLLFLDKAMEEQSANVAMVVTERYRLPSRFDKRLFDDVVAPGARVNRELANLEGFNSDKSTIWHFIAFNLDPARQDPDLAFFCIGTLPEKITTMIDGLENFDPKFAQLMKKPPNSNIDNAGVLMGKERLKKLKKKVGDVFEATSTSHRTKAGLPIVVQMEIVGELPGESRWSEGAFMDYAYLDRLMKANDCPLYGKVNLGWLRVADQRTVDAASAIIEKNLPEIKSETGASGVSRFLEPYKNLLAIVKFVLAPAICIVLMLVVANSIMITVRERMREMAVLKVLGFSPGRIATLVLGESLLVGTLCGLASGVATYALINWLMGGIKIPFAFFPIFFVPGRIILYGTLLGAATAFLGALIPSVIASRVRAAAVFAKAT